MKIRINRDTLTRGMGWVQSIVERRSTMPVLSHALLKAHKGYLEVAATNLQMVVEGHLEAQVEEEGGLSINARRLLDIIKVLPSGEITITTDDKNRAEIKGEKGTFHLLGLAQSEYPPLPEYEGVTFVEIDAEILKSMVEKTVFAASLEETRYNLEGVFLQVVKDEGKLRMVATDGHRLCLVDKDVQNADKLALGDGVILPRKGLGELRKLLSEGDDIEKVGFGIVANDVVFKCGDVVLMMRTLEGDYPDYQRVIPNDNDKKVVGQREKLLESIGRVSIISDEKTRGVRVSVEPGKLKIESQNPEVGDAYEELEVETGISDLEIGYNARYLIDALNAMECENVDIFLKDGLSSGLLTSGEDEGYICVVMPMRL